MTTEPAVTAATRHAMTEAAAKLPLHNTQDFDDAERGFLGRS